MSAGEMSHAALMDRVYRHQRHIYDVTRRYYLLGRGALIAALNPPPGGHVLEVGCGTGRNMVQAARRYPAVGFYGLDISAEMLASAAGAARRSGLAARIALARGDATEFDAELLFGRARFERVYMSYVLSMIPDWRGALRQAAGCVEAGGELLIVDFGRQERLPGWFKSLLRGWLRRFHVAPRDDLETELRALARDLSCDLRFESLYRGYAVFARLRF